MDNQHGTNQPASRLPDWLSTLARPGNGEMGQRIAALEWSDTPAGPAHLWPQSLKSTVKTLLASRYPMILLWGYDELIQFYNDAYINLIGNKHPEALGRSIRDTQFESWNAIGPMIYDVLDSGIPNWVAAQLLPLERSGYLEESYFSLSYSAVDDDSGTIRGMLCVCSEVTQQILAERRLKLLRDLAAKASEVRSVEDTCVDMVSVISEHQLDVPFALIYLRESGGDTFRLTGRVGLNEERPSIPDSFCLNDPQDGIWPFIESASGETVLFKDIKQYAQVVGGPWDTLVTEALFMPLSSSGQAAPQGILIAGISPNRALDNEYTAFYKLFRDQVSVSLQSARAYEVERKRAEMLAELDRAKTAFFSNVSHEFRTPLTLLLGPLEDMLSSSKETEIKIRREPLEAAYRNGVRLLKLVNTLLDFSRVEAGRIEASFEPTDLATYTRELVSHFRSAIEHAGLRFTIEIPDISEHIFIDHEMWEKIVFNLLSNAFKFTLEGEIEVRLSETVNGIQLQVRDTGAGIPEKDLPRIFERFHRVEGARSRSHEGSGIGLALVQELVHLHQGSINVMSTLGKGSTFVVTLSKGTSHLPADRIRASRSLGSTRSTVNAYLDEASLWLSEAEERIQKIEDRSEQKSQPKEKKTEFRILLVDDNKDMRDYLTRLLTDHYEILTAPNGKVALELVQQQLPDLVLSDVMMPEMDGFELLRSLRANVRTKRIPIILLSARAGQESTVVGIEAGADDYLIKPFSAKELLARVRQHLAMTKLRQEYELEHEIRQKIEESEKRFRQLAEAIPQMVWKAGPDGSVEYTNTRWHEYTGLSWEETKGWGWTQALHPNELDQTSKLWAEAASLNQPFVHEHRVRRASDDTYRWHLIRAIPIHDEHGNIIQWFGTNTDIEDQKHAITVRDEFLSVVSHELKTPLAALMLHLQLCMRKLKPETSGTLSLKTFENSLMIALQQVDQLNSLVADLLDLSSIQVGRFTITFSEVRFHDLLESVIQRYQAQLEAAKCSLELDIDTHLRGNWDSARIEQVLINLISNAIKYAPGKSVKIIAKQLGEFAQISVHDDGPGIPKEKQEAIFDRYERAVSALNISGLGLGLFISKQIIEGHKGSIRLNSTPGQGSTFIVELPLNPC